MRRRARELSGYGVVLAGTAGARGASFAATVIIARELGPSGFGDFTLFFAVLVPFISATDFIDLGYVRYANITGELRAMDYLRAALILKIGAIVALVACSYPLAVVFADVVFEDSSLAPTLTLAILCGVLVGLISLRAATFLAEKRYGRYGMVNSLFYIAILVALVPWVALDQSIDATTVYALFFSTSLVLGLACLASLMHSAWPIRPRRIALRNMLRFAKWLVVAQVLFVAAQRLDIMLLSRYVAIEDVGQYGAALRITVIASLMIGSMASFLLPRATRAHGSLSGLRNYLVEGAYLAGGLCAGVLAVWIVAPVLVPLFFGQDFEPAIPLTRILLLGVGLLAISTPMVQLFLADERPRHVPLYFLSKYSVLAAVTIILAPRLGASGAAWAFSLSEAVGLAYAGVVVLSRWHSLKVRAGSQPVS